MGGEERSQYHPARRYANFQDPFGVVLRMLRSGNRAARSALYLAALEQLIKPLDWAMADQEKRRLSEAAETEFPLLLVVGSPRSGTTLVASLLVQLLAVTYIDNFSALFRHAPLTAASLSRRVGLVREGRSSLTNFYGNTAGVSSPNDGFNIWNRWLGENRYEPLTNISDDAKAQMQQFFSAWSSSFGRPFLNKNNRNLGCIAMLGAALPTSHFIVVRRRPFYVAQSLLLAREVVQGDRRAGWGFGAAREPCDDPVADVVRQVQAIENTLDEQCALVDPSRIMEVPYEDFCTRPQYYADGVTDRFLHQAPRNGSGSPRLPRLEPSRGDRLPSAQVLRLKRELEHAGLDGASSPDRLRGNGPAQ